MESRSMVDEPVSLRISAPGSRSLLGPQPGGRAQNTSRHDDIMVPIFRE